MTIAIRPDPARPRGGFAVLAVPGAAVAGDRVTVALQSTYTDKYLGEDGFQTEPAAFGPYPVVRDGAEARVTVGPEIVNQLEEYAQLRITLGGVTATATWPDSVVPAPGAARLGGLVAPGDRAAVAAAPAPVVAPVPDPGPDPVGADDPTPTEAAPALRRGLLLAAGLAVLVLAAAGALYLAGVFDPPPEVAVAPPAIERAITVAPAADPCAADAVAALRGQPFADVAPRLRDCGAAVAPEAALLLLEDAVAAGEAGALVVFGRLYDAAAVDGDFETVIGLTFADAPAIAADYYARASAAGAAEAAALLAAACVRLAALTDTPSQAARDAHCRP
ncbi:MAG: hypothetical protein MUF73_13475 [Rhodobacteraceae bacterium]|jgi:hypothetical protein|nr:hypothetical protein [Paracoccaceae bacterium]